MVLIPVSFTMSGTSVHSSSGTLSDLIPWIYLSLLIYNHKGFDLGHTWMVFPTFFNLSLKKEVMIWATVSSRSCFCWLYRASPSLAAKNMINLISMWTIWWCPCVKSSLVLLEEGVCHDHVFSWQNSVRLCPASFCILRPNLPVTPGISWLPAFLKFYFII